jgi:hypothetical protein
MYQVLKALYQSSGSLDTQRLRYKESACCCVCDCLVFTAVRVSVKCSVRKSPASVLFGVVGDRMVLEQDLGIGKIRLQWVCF